MVMEAGVIRGGDGCRRRQEGTSSRSVGGIDGKMCEPP